MHRGKSTPLSKNEEQFILQSITERIVWAFITYLLCFVNFAVQRLDKRDAYDYRDIDICIDNDNPGMVEARIGDTR